MSTLNVNLKDSQYAVGERVYAYKHHGELRTHELGGPRTAKKVAEAVSRIGEGGLAARLFVGLNVGQKTAFSRDEVVDILVKVRKKQKALPDASILSQLGVYTDSETGALVKEPSVQIVVIDVVGKTKGAFVKEMKELGEVLREKLKQQLVILEIQKSGVVTDVYAITASEKKKRMKKRGKK